MKKLMVASAAVALAGVSFAKVEEARVYDVKAIAMTTVAAKNTVGKDFNPFLTRDRAGIDQLVYRQITTKSYSGLIWGCDCDAIAGYTEKEEVAILGPDLRPTGQTTNHWEGSVIWDDQPVKVGGRDVYRTVWVGPAADEREGAGKGIWKFINVVEALGDKVEGCWEINPITPGCTSTSTTNMLVGAGFGYLAGAGESLNTTTNCATATPSYMTGYFAGYVGAPILSWNNSRPVCIYCQQVVIDSDCVAAEVWDFCRCVPFMDAEKTACFGQWTLSVDPELSNAIMNEVDALDAFPLTEEIKAEVLAVRATIR